MLCVFVPLFLAMKAKNAFPQNIGFVFLFTFAEGLYIAPFIAIAEQHNPGIASQAGLLTFAAFGSLTMYAFLSRRDFSAWGSFLFVGLIVLILTSVLNMFFGSASGYTWIAGIGVLLFSGLLVFDTWRLRNRVRAGRLRVGGCEHLSRPAQHVPVHPVAAGREIERTERMAGD